MPMGIVARGCKTPVLARKSHQSILAFPQAKPFHLGNEKQ